MKNCRICWDSEKDMVQPCKCSGTMANVHIDCLTKWLEYKSISYCEVCKSEYNQGAFKNMALIMKLKIMIMSHTVLFFSVLVAQVVVLLIIILNFGKLERRDVNYGPVYLNSWPYSVDNCEIINLEYHGGRLKYLRYVDEKAQHCEQLDIHWDPNTGKYYLWICCFQEE